MQATAELKHEAEQTIYRILFAISFVHLLNDTIQAVVPAIFPILQDSMHLSNLELGFITFALNITSSLMQPVVGLYSDRKPKPYLLPLGMVFTFIGMFGLALSPNLLMIILSVIFVGLGSATFHPEGSKVSYMAAGRRRGLAQSIYQVGGNTGTSLGYLMTGLIFVPLGQFGAIWFTAAAALAIIVLTYIAGWYQAELRLNPKFNKPKTTVSAKKGLNKKIVFAISVLILMVFVRSWYSAAISNFYSLYLIRDVGMPIHKAINLIFLFSLAGVVGTFLGGPLSDRFGKRNLILFSMLGSAPLAILMPYLDSFWLYPVILLNGFIILSSFSVTVVYAQELVPGKIGLVSGLIVGLAFGLGAIGSVVIGGLADWIGLKAVMHLAGWLPLLGIFTFLLPSDRQLQKWHEEKLS